MRKVKVELGTTGYEVRVGAGLLYRIGLWLKEKGLTGKAVIITDATVKTLYADELIRGLANAGFSVTVLDVPPGEDQKTLTVAGRLYNKLMAAYVERNTPVLALGGGMIGDLAGFVAATYMRGLPLVQVPTTLLAQVDSSIGGKTAVDYGKLKNIVGVFYQPIMVVSDIETLQTLPQAELSNGMAEIIKHAAIRNSHFFQFLETNLRAVKAPDSRTLETIVLENARIKADVVEKDEKETGLRAILNYGHTVGHAIEAVSNFELKHGQAVAIGMMAAAKISSRMGILSEHEVFSLEGVLKNAGLPVKMPDLDKEEVLQVMQHDKKVLQEKLRFVLLKSIGHAFVTDEVDPALVKEVLIGWG
jgi:3-dehydroquinate synthase